MRLYIYSYIKYVLVVLLLLVLLLKFGILSKLFSGFFYV